MRLSHQQIEAAFEQGLEAVLALVESLQQQHGHLQLYVAALEQRLADLENRLKQNSGNSSRPPSSDFLRKTPPPKPPAGRKWGRQPGHPGRSLDLVAVPDVVVEHAPAACACCSGDLSEQPPSGHLRRQVFDLPPVTLQVTEHQALEKRCPRCGTTTRGAFPAEVPAPVQYGPRLRALVLYLSTYQLLPYDRLSQVIEDMTGQSISTGTLAEMVRQGAERLSTPCEEIKQAVAASAVVHGDETGMYVDGELCWLHVASTATETLYQITKKRGKAGMDAIGVLPQVTGTMVHDGLAGYQKYEGCAHALCNAHHLRELAALEEQGSRWARRMRKLLLETKQAVDEARAQGADRPTAEVIAWFKARYVNEIERAWKDVGPPPQEVVRRELDDGSIDILVRTARKKGKSYNLLVRLDERREQVLRFLTEEWVPFENNQAERDLRMGKLKQKISGCFRSGAGAASFCRLRSYVSTMRKQGRGVLAALQAAVEGNPLSPTPS